MQTGMYPLPYYLCFWDYFKVCCWYIHLDCVIAFYKLLNIIIIRSRKVQWYVDCGDWTNYLTSHHEWGIQVKYKLMYRKLGICCFTVKVLVKRHDYLWFLFFHFLLLARGWVVLWIYFGCDVGRCLWQNDCLWGIMC